MSIDGKVIEVPLDEKIFPKIDIKAIRNKVADWYTTDEFIMAIKTCKVELHFKLDEKK